MRIRNTIVSGIIAVTQSRQMRPVLMTLAIVVAVLGAAGCPGPHH